MQKMEVLNRSVITALEKYNRRDFDAKNFCLRSLMIVFFFIKKISRHPKKMK